MLRVPAAGDGGAAEQTRPAAAVRLAFSSHVVALVGQGTPGRPWEERRPADLAREHLNLATSDKIRRPPAPTIPRGSRPLVASMTWDAWSAFVATVLVLALVPGPSSLLVASVAVDGGLRPAHRTIVGDLTANLIQMLIASLGLELLVAGAEGWLAALQVAGVCYLGYLGIARLLGGAEHGAGRRGREHAFLRGFAIAATNPKAVLFFAAFFPIFLDGEAPLPPQLLLLGVTYALIDGTTMCLYALLARRLSAGLRSGAARPARRLGGILYIATAGLLGLRLVTDG